jgi:hypothetical protein
MLFGAQKNKNQINKERKIRLISDAHIIIHCLRDRITRSYTFLKDLFEGKKIIVLSFTRLWF